MRCLSWILKDNYIRVPDNQMGALYEKRYNLRGKDQKYFLDFYKIWTEKKGSGYEQYFDDATSCYRLKNIPMKERLKML
jgi:hypothetical protein